MKPSIEKILAILVCLALLFGASVPISTVAIVNKVVKEKENCAGNAFFKGADNKVYQIVKSSKYKKFIEEDVAIVKEYGRYSDIKDQITHPLPSDIED